MPRDVVSVVSVRKLALILKQGVLHSQPTSTASAMHHETERRLDLINLLIPVVLRIVYELFVRFESVNPNSTQRSAEAYCASESSEYEKLIATARAAAAERDSIFDLSSSRLEAVTAEKSRKLKMEANQAIRALLARCDMHASTLKINTDLTERFVRLDELIAKDGNVEHQDTTKTLDVLEMTVAGLSSLIEKECKEYDQALE